MRRKAQYSTNMDSRSLPLDNSSVANREQDINELQDNYHQDYSPCPLLGEINVFVTVARTAAYVVIATISLIGNLLIIIVSRKSNRTRKVAYSLIVNMAVADLLTTIINVPESLVVEIRDTDEWMQGVVGVILCKGLPFCQLICAFCSILSLLGIALDRFFAVCLPLKRILNPKRCRIIIAISWMIPFIASAPVLVANNVTNTDGLLLCLEQWPAPFNSAKASRDYTTILFVLFYVLPLITMATLYIRVIYVIWKRKHPGNLCSKQKMIHSRSKKRALKMFVTVVICFALCWLPYHVAYFLTAYDQKYYNCGLPENVDFVALFVAHASSAFNPCIYMIFDKKYRVSAKRITKNICCTFM